jgi:peptidoglycan/xylan/chitin deacetylase (PgdA/CDA1 family)
VDETARNKELLESLVGRPIRLFRPPWGRHDKRVDRAAEASNQSLVLYSLDSKDWQHKSETMTVDRVVSSAVDGDIILFHDTLPSTVNAARQLVGELKRAGFTMVTVSTLLGETTPGRCYDGVIGRRTRWRRWAEVQGRAWRSRLGRLARIRPLRSTQ